MVKTAVKSVVLQGIDALFDGRMFPSLSNKLIRALKCPLFFATSSFFRQHYQIQYFLKLLYILRSVEVFVKAAACQLRKYSLCRPHEGNRHLLVGALSHHQVVQKKSTSWHRVVMTFQACLREMGAV